MQAYDMGRGKLAAIFNNDKFEHLDALSHDVEEHNLRLLLDKAGFTILDTFKNRTAQVPRSSFGKLSISQSHGVYT